MKRALTAADSSAAPLHGTKTAKEQEGAPPAGSGRALMIKVALVTGWLARIALWVAGTGLILMTAFVFAQVLARYVFNSSLQWAEPASIQIMGWFIFLGAAVGIREGYHLSFDVLLYVLPPRVKSVLHSISDAVVAAFGWGMLWYGFQLTEKVASSIVPGLGISRGWDFAPVIGGGALLFLYSLERIFRRLAGLPTVRFGDDASND